MRQLENIDSTFQTLMEQHQQTFISYTRIAQLHTPFELQLFSKSTTPIFSQTTDTQTSTRPQQRNVFNKLLEGARILRAVFVPIVIHTRKIATVDPPDAHHD